MRIGFNGHRLAGQRLGVGRYIEYMLRYWGGMLGPAEEVELFLRRPLDPAARAELGLPASIHETVLGPDVSGIVWENLALRRQARRLDVLFCPAYTAPVGYRRPFVVATHSVNEVEPGARQPLHDATYARLYRHCARRADAVIVPAEVTRQAVVERYGVPEERVAVVHQGADDAFRPIDDSAVLRATRARYFGTGRPYILFVGKCSVRRNIPILVRAYAELRRARGIPHGLLLFGPNHEGLPLAELCRELGVAGDVVQTDGRVAHHADLIPVYAAADVFVHPSTFEGWSITTVEAMACGTAVVAADRGGLGEVARGHALMVADPSVDALVDAIGRVLEDDVLRQDLRRRARARGCALGWREMTRQTLDVLRDVAARPRH